MFDGNSRNVLLDYVMYFSCVIVCLHNRFLQTFPGSMQKCESWSVATGLGLNGLRKLRVKNKGHKSNMILLNVDASYL